MSFIFKYQIVADKTRYYKENEEGVNTISKIVEDLIEEARKEVRESLIKNCLKKGKSCEVVADIFDVPLEEVQKIKDNM